MQVLNLTIQGDSRNVRLFNPPFESYSSAFIISTYWFRLITTGPDSVSSGSLTVPWTVTSPLIGGGRANHRPSGSSGPIPTIDLLAERGSGTRHNTPGYANVTEVKFPYSDDSSLPNCLPDPLVLREREDERLEYEIPPISVPDIPYIPFPIPDPDFDGIPGLPIF